MTDDESLRTIALQGPLSPAELQNLNKYQLGSYLAWAEAALKEMGKAEFVAKRDALKADWEYYLSIGMVADPTFFIEKGLLD